MLEPRSDHHNLSSVCIRPNCTVNNESLTHTCTHWGTITRHNVRTVQQTRDVTQFTIKANVTFRARTFQAERARSTAETRVNLYRLSPLHAFPQTRYKIGLSPLTKRTIDMTSYKTSCLTFWNTDGEKDQTRYTNRFSHRFSHLSVTAGYYFVTPWNREIFICEVRIL